MNDYNEDELYLIDRLLAMEDQMNFKYEKLRLLITERLNKANWTD